MPTKKKTARPSAETPQEAPQHSGEFDAALQKYESTLHKMRNGEFETAGSEFDELASAVAGSEPVLAERCRTYSSYCAAKLKPKPTEPQTPEECYHRAVMLTNDGEADRAISLLDHALQSDPNSPKLLYARATAWALKCNTEAAVGDLRQAISAEPQLRFLAVNDPDFEKIREEPAFIDVIEPTPAST